MVDFVDNKLLADLVEPIVFDIFGEVVIGFTVETVDNEVPSESVETVVFFICGRFVIFGLITLVNV